jgi:hypothetical protein
MLPVIKISNGKAIRLHKYEDDVERYLLIRAGRYFYIETENMNIGLAILRSDLFGINRSEFQTPSILSQEVTESTAVRMIRETYNKSNKASSKTPFNDHLLFSVMKNRYKK